MPYTYLGRVNWTLFWVFVVLALTLFFPKTMITSIFIFGGIFLVNFLFKNQNQFKDIAPAINKRAEEIRIGKKEKRSKNK